MNILSIGYTRDFWVSPAQRAGDTVERLQWYARHLDSYHVLVHARGKCKVTPSKVSFAPNAFAIASNGYTPMDSWFNLLRIGYRLGKQHKYDLIQAQDPIFTGSVALQLSRMLKIPFSVCVYGVNPYDKFWQRASKVNYIGSIIGKKVLNKASGIQVDGKKTQRVLEEHGIPTNKVFLKPMIPYNIATFLSGVAQAEVRQRLFEKPYGEGIFGLFVGRLAPQKNLLFLLEVVSKVIQLVPDFKVLIIGEGPEYSTIKRNLIRLNLDSNVFLLGKKSHRDISDYMLNCDLFMLASLYEGFARVLMEAAAAGKCIITTDVSGADDAVINNETGFIIRQGDKSMYVQRLLQVIRDAEMRESMGKKGRIHIRQIVKEYSDLSRQIHIWQTILNNALVNV